MPSDNPYRVLGLAREASAEEIRCAYRAKSLLVHPDRNGDTPEANAAMRALNAAFDALKSDEARAQTDAELAARARPSAPPKSVWTICKEVFHELPPEVVGELVVASANATLHLGVLLMQAFKRPEARPEPLPPPTKRKKKRKRPRRAQFRDVRVT